MRSATSIGFGLAAALVAGAALAADPVGLVPSYRVPTQPLSLLTEFRIGGSAHDPYAPEGGSANITGEALFAKPFTTGDLFTSYFIPRPHIGGSLNFRGDTSFAYAGLTWTVDITPAIFVEGTFGGAIHDGATGPKANVPSYRNSLGCSPLFRESATLGFRLNANWSVMATVEHMSNAGLCVENRGLTNFGARLGYTF